MSNISTVYDNLRTSIGAALSAHVELANPYFIDEKNDDLNFKKAWGIAVGDGSNSERQLSCHLTIARDFVVVITRKLFIANRDISIRITTEKDLFEDQNTVIQTLQKDSTLNSSGLIVSTDYVEDGGLEFIRTGRTDLIMIQSIIKVEYFEDLT